MFVQVFQGQVSDASQVREAAEDWVQRLAPSAEGVWSERSSRSNQACDRVVRSSQRRHWSIDPWGTTHCAGCPVISAMRSKSAS